MVYYEEQLDEPADEPVPISVRELAAAAAAASRKRCRHCCLLPLCSSVCLTPHHAAGLATASVVCHRCLLQLLSIVSCYRACLLGASAVCLMWSPRLVRALGLRVCCGAHVCLMLMLRAWVSNLSRSCSACTMPARSATPRASGRTACQTGPSSPPLPTSPDAEKNAAFSAECAAHKKMATCLQKHCLY